VKSLLPLRPGGTYGVVVVGTFEVDVDEVFEGAFFFVVFVATVGLTERLVPI
jgi:hypothetical protein